MSLLVEHHSLVLLGASHELLARTLGESFHEHFESLADVLAVLLG